MVHTRLYQKRVSLLIHNLAILIRCVIMLDNNFMEQTLVEAVVSFPGVYSICQYNRCIDGMCESEENCLNCFNIHDNQTRITKAQISYEQPVRCIEKEDKQQQKGKERSTSDSEEEIVWSQIKVVIKRISLLEQNLKSERAENKKLHEKLISCDRQIQIYAQQIETHYEDRNQSTIRETELNARIKDLEDMIKDKVETITNLQSYQIKRNTETEDRIKKMTTENRQLLDKLRKSNMELQKERNSRKELKEEMTNKLQTLQSEREEYLKGQIQALRDQLRQAKQQKQIKLEQQIQTLKRRIYILTKQIDKQDITINLMEKKKQEAINQIVRKGELESKIQKSIHKALTEKYNKLQAEMNHLRNHPPDHRVRLINKGFEAQISLELSPQVA